jgi:hypothetical protein
MGLSIMMLVQILERKNVNLASLGSLIQLQKHHTTEPTFEGKPLGYILGEKD